MQVPPDIALGGLVIGIILLVAFATAMKGQGASPYHRGHYRPRLAYDRDRQRAPTSQMTDAADQLRAVENAKYGKQPLLRFQESKVFAAAEAAVREAGMPWRVFAQVSLGEVLTCADRSGFNAINAKRVDLLIADANFAPLAAIEYQGSGHHLSKAAARDAVKKEALRKAGIGYIEITQDHGPEDVRREIGRLAFMQALTADKRARPGFGG